MIYNGDMSTMYKLGFNRGRAGIKHRESTKISATNEHYREGVRDGYKQYKRDKLEQLIFEDPK